MFRYIAEDIAFLLIKSKAINIEERDVYVFGLEVLLLNSINVLTALIISLISGTMWHFAAFLLIFAPLRIFSGGYHAKRSETCFVISTLVYIASVLIVKLYPLLYVNTVITAALLIPSVLLTVSLAPVVNKNNPLREDERKRYRLVSIVLIVFDSVIFIMFKCWDFSPAASVMIFLAVNSITMLAGLISDKLDKCAESDDSQ